MIHESLRPHSETNHGDHEVVIHEIPIVSHFLSVPRLEYLFLHARTHFCLVFAKARYDSRSLLISMHEWHKVPQTKISAIFLLRPFLLIKSTLRHIISMNFPQFHVFLRHFNEFGINSPIQILTLFNIFSGVL